MADELVINTADLGLGPKSMWVTIYTCDVDGSPVHDVTSGGVVVVSPLRVQTGSDGNVTVPLIPTDDLDQANTFYKAEAGAYDKVFEKGPDSENLVDLVSPVSPAPRTEPLALDGLSDVDSPIGDRDDGQVFTWRDGAATFEVPSAGVTSVVAGPGISVNSTNPAAPIVTAEVTQAELDAVAAAKVSSVVAGNGVTVDSSNPQNPVVSASGGTPTVSTKTANYTAVSGDVVLANAVSAGFTVTLPAATSGRVVTVKKIDATGNTVRVVPPSGTIDGETVIDVNVPWQSRDFVANGTSWYLV